jgi:hypothetical protein
MLTLPRWTRFAAAGAVLAAVAVAVPVLAGALPLASPAAVAPAAEDPEATAAPEATGKPGKGPKDEHPGQGRGPASAPGLTNRAAKPAEAPVELTGRVGTRDADGRIEYTLTSGGTTVVLEAGPPWWWGEDHPLAPYVGSTVTIQGARAEGSDEVDVHAVDGSAIREPGRPPWAGGPKVVGEAHPGWKAWKAERGIGRPSWAGPPGAEDEGS